LGHCMQARLRARGATKISVIDNWADAGISLRPRAGHPMRERWGNADKTCVVYSGNLGLAHDVDTLQEAMLELRGERGLDFCIIGDGVKRAGLQAALAAAGMKQVRFLPYVPRPELGLS